jgi:hypothetical protein
MDGITVNQDAAITKMYHSYLQRLGRESEDGAGDRILDIRIDSNGIIRHGGVKFDSEFGSPGELHNMLNVLETYGLAVKESNRPEINLSNKDSAPSRRLERINIEFKKEQNRVGLGADVGYYFNLGDPQENPYLRAIVNSHLYKSQKRVGDIFTNQISQENSKDKNFLDVIMRELTDSGRAIDPANIRVVGEKEGDTIDASVQDKIFGIASALYAGKTQL